MFFQNGIRDATSGGMGKNDEDSVGDMKKLEYNHMENFEDSQQEQFNSKDGFGTRYEKRIQVSKKTSNRHVSKIKIS